MSKARCTLQVLGLDCPKEVDSLTAALNDQAGVARLGFDLIHGTMTIDYDDEMVDPEAIIRRIADRTGLRATLEDDVERTVPSWWSRHGRWVVTGGSGLALAVGAGLSWLGPALGLEQFAALRLAQWAYALAVVVGGVGIFPQAARNLARLRFDIDVLMGLAILGAMALGQWDEAATVAFLYGLSEALETMSLDYARRSIRALLELAPPTAERIGADGTTQKVAASRDSPWRSCAGSHRRHNSGGRHGGTRAVKRRPEDDHWRVGPRAARRRRSGLRGDDQRRRHARSHGRGTGG